MNQKLLQSTQRAECKEECAPSEQRRKQKDLLGLNGYLHHDLWEISDISLNSSWQLCVQFKPSAGLLHTKCSLVIQPRNSYSCFVLCHSLILELSSLQEYMEAAVTLHMCCQNNWMIHIILMMSFYARILIEAYATGKRNHLAQQIHYYHGEYSWNSLGRLNYLRPMLA